jgi:hypothetical protein
VDSLDKPLKEWKDSNILDIEKCIDIHEEEYKKLPREDLLHTDITKQNVNSRENKEFIEDSNTEMEIIHIEKEVITSDVSSTEEEVIESESSSKEEEVIESEVNSKEEGEISIEEEDMAINSQERSSSESSISEEEEELFIPKIIAKKEPKTLQIVISE